MGSCSLTAVQYEGKLYVANSGDSKGVIISINHKDISILKVNKKLNAGSKKE